ncbi:MAG TPA: hypothetical protein PLO86_02170 [Syntrophales bacterium]|nr:hypothetical protein [Syntrophales bacterium]
MEQRPSEGFFVKLRTVLLIILFASGLCSIVGTGGGGGSSGGTEGTSGGGTTAATMEEDIGGKADKVLDVIQSEGVTEGVDVLTSLLEEEELPQGLITVTPDSIDLENLPETITVVIDFGAGYTTDDGSLFTGRGTITVSDIVVSETAIGASFSAVFNDIAVNGQTYLNGAVSGSLSISQNTQGAMVLSGSIGFQNFEWAGNPFSGSITFSSTPLVLDLNNPSGTVTVAFNAFVFGENSISGSVSLVLDNLASETLRIVFDNFTMNDFTITSGTVDVTLTDEDQGTFDLNLNTSEGIMDIAVNVTAGETSVVLDTETAGILGGYTVSINDVTIPMDWETVPASGNMTFTDTSAGVTATLTFNKTLASDPPYDYSETP